jgi:hypothetical protein
MTENQKQFYGGLALIVFGIGIALFGGTKSTGGTRFTLFGFEFGAERSEPMSRGESLFWGVAMIVFGAILIATS